MATPQGNEVTFAPPAQAAAAAEDDGTLSMRIAKSWDKSTKAVKQFIMSTSEEAFRTLFKELPADEVLLDDFSCALQKEILVHGRMYISQNYICFHSNIFGWETSLIHRCTDVSQVRKERTAFVIPNAILLVTAEAKHLFASFISRDCAFRCLSIVVRNAHSPEPMTADDLLANYGKQWRANIENEPTVARLAQLAVDEDRPQSGQHTPRSEDPASAPAAADTHAQATASPVNTTSAASLAPSQSTPREGQAAQRADSHQSHILGDEASASAPVSCTCDVHPPRQYLDTIIHYPVDEVFKLLFTGSDFFRELYRQRNCSELRISDWRAISSKAGLRERDIGYMLALNYAIGPKQTLVAEKQVEIFSARPGQCYVVEGSVSTPKVPYGESFYTVSRYCLTYQSPRECRLRVNSEIRYHKAPWALARSVIESNGYDGLRNYLQHLLAALQEYVASHPVELQAPPAVLTRALSARSEASESFEPVTPIVKSPSIQNISMDSHYRTPVQSQLPQFGADDVDAARAAFSWQHLVVLLLFIVLLVSNFVTYWKLGQEQAGDCHCSCDATLEKIRSLLAE